MIKENTENLVRRHEEETGFGRVSNLYESYFILADGTFLGCNYDCGSRGDDHRSIFGATDIAYNDFESLHTKYKVLRFMPEGDCVWVKKEQKISSKQQKVIDTYDLEIVRY